LLKTGLEEENHVVDMAFDGISGLELAQAINFERNHPGCNAAEA